MATDTYKLYRIIKNVVDNRGPRQAYYFESEKYPVIDTYMIRNEVHPSLDDATRYLSASQFNSFLRGHIGVNDLLIVLVGNGIGNVTLAPNAECAIVQNVIGLTFNNMICDQVYMYYKVKTMQTSIRNLDRGVSQPSVNRDDLFRLSIMLPDVDTQKRIGQSLYRYDRMIEVNNKRIKVLEQIAENLYKEWFVCFRFPGHKSVPFENGLPRGWRLVRTSSICKITTGRKDANQADSQGKYPFFSCARENDLFSNDAFLDDKAIIVSGNGSFTGYTKCYRGKFDLYQRTYALYDINTISWQYLYWTYKLGFEKEYMGGNRGSAIPYITKPDIERYKIIVPDEKTLRAATNCFDTVYDLCEALMEENKRLVKQRDLLLPRLMSGKLEV